MSLPSFDDFAVETTVSVEHDSKVTANISFNDYCKPYIRDDDEETSHVVESDEAIESYVVAIDNVLQRLLDSPEVMCRIPMRIDLQNSLATTDVAGVSRAAMTAWLSVKLADPKSPFVRTRAGYIMPRSGCDLKEQYQFCLLVFWATKFDYCRPPFAPFFISVIANGVEYVSLDEGERVAFTAHDLPISECYDELFEFLQKASRLAQSAASEDADDQLQNMLSPTILTELGRSAFSGHEICSANLNTIMRKVLLKVLVLELLVVVVECRRAAEESGVLEFLKNSLEAALHVFSSVDNVSAKSLMPIFVLKPENGVADPKDKRSFSFLQRFVRQYDSQDLFVYGNALSGTDVSLSQDFWRRHEDLLADISNEVEITNPRYDYLTRGVRVENSHASVRALLNVSGVVIRRIDPVSDEQCETAGMRSVPILSALLYFSTSTFSLHAEVSIVPLMNVGLPYSSTCFRDLYVPKDISSYDSFRERLLKSISAYDYFGLF